MKTSIDNTLNRLASRTHSPRGRHAATEQTYQALLSRIPAEHRPVQMASIRHRSGFQRWKAACALFVIGIGMALAGVWYRQYYKTAPMSESSQKEEKCLAGTEVRTLSYEAVPLSEIVAELSDVYHMPIDIKDPELRDYRITATFRTNETLHEILAILAEIGNFEVRDVADGYVIISY